MLGALPAAPAAEEDASACPITHSSSAKKVHGAPWGIWQRKAGCATSMATGCLLPPSFSHMLFPLSRCAFGQREGCSHAPCLCLAGAALVRMRLACGGCCSCRNAHCQLPAPPCPGCSPATLHFLCEVCETGSTKEHQGNCERMPDNKCSPPKKPPMLLLVCTCPAVPTIPCPLWGLAGQAAEAITAGQTGHCFISARAWQHQPYDPKILQSG